jgi:hypothetical protein
MQMSLSMFLIAILVLSTIVLILGGPSSSSLSVTATVSDGTDGVGESILPQQLEDEDCIIFDPTRAEIQNIGGGWKVVMGNISLLDFADNQTNAQRALEVIRHYNLSLQCFVGRPDPPMQYYLTNGTNGTVAAPKGPSLPGGGEDCLSFNPQNTTVEQIAGTWKVVDGSHWILDFGTSQDNANKALQIIKKYNFDHICFVGRPDPEMMYFVTNSSAPPRDEEPFVSEPVTPVSPEIDLSNENLTANNLTTNQPAKPGDPIVEFRETEEGVRVPNIVRPQNSSEVHDEGAFTSSGIINGFKSSLAHSWTYLLGAINDIWKTMTDFTDIQHESYSALATPTFSIPLVNFEGIPAAIVPQFGAVPYPPDTVGDVGPNHYVQAVNSQFAIFDKNGNTLAGPFFLNQPWVIAANQGSIDPSDPCVTNNDGDPYVLYDHLADRWLVSQFVAFTNQCIAISRTSDPVSGGWHLYNFDTGGVKNDYPKFGLWPDAYYMGTNANYPSGHAWAFDRDSMLSGSPATYIRLPLTGSLPSLLLPSDLDGPAPPAGAPNVFMRFVDDAEMGGADRLEMLEFHVDFMNPNLSSLTALPDLTTTIESSLCGFVFANPCVPQPGTPVILDPLREWLMTRLQYRNFGGYETLVVNHSVDVDAADRAGIRWYELRKIVGGSWSIFQQGNYSPDTMHRWMGSIGMNKDGHIALGYSASSGTEPPSIRYAGRLASDPLGTLPQGEFNIFGSGGSQGVSSRWGDYSAMSVDPVDDCTFWYTTEYFSSSTGNWGTRIASVRISDCNQPPVANGQSVTTNQNTPIPITLSAADPDGDPITYSIVTNPDPSRGSLNPPLNPSTGTVTYTPVPSYFGPDSFTFKATDNRGADSNTATVSITVKGPPDCNNPTIPGTNGNNVLQGTPGNDVINGLGGNDVINGRGGNDEICGADGNDVINSGDGNDRINGGTGRDVINSMGGNDQVYGREGNDVINSGNGNDLIDGGPDSDIGNAGPGQDICFNVEIASNCEA